jgi:hypothetical protein
MGCAIYFIRWCSLLIRRCVDADYADKAADAVNTFDFTLFHALCTLHHAPALLLQMKCISAKSPATRDSSHVTGLDLSAFGAGYWA